MFVVVVFNNTLIQFLGRRVKLQTKIKIEIKINNTFLQKYTLEVYIEVSYFLKLHILVMNNLKTYFKIVLYIYFSIYFIAKLTELQFYSEM